MVSPCDLEMIGSELLANRPKEGFTSPFGNQNHMGLAIPARMRQALIEFWHTVLLSFELIKPQGGLYSLNPQKLIKPHWSNQWLTSKVQLGRGRDKVQDSGGASWEVVCDGATFESQRLEPAFQSVVALSRAVNALRFSASALIDVEGDNSPTALRQRINSFLYSSALLFEAFELVERTRNSLAKYSKYQVTLGALLDDEKVADVRKKIAPLRNRGVFHFDPSFIPKRVSVESDGWCRFGQGRGLSVGSSYYDLSDRALLEAFVGGPAEEFKVRYDVLVRDTTTILFKFVDGADRLIESALLENGWIVRDVDCDPDANA